MINLETALMRNFPLHCAVKIIPVESETKTRYGNVVGYSYNIINQPMLIVQLFSNPHNKKPESITIADTWLERIY